MLFVGLMQCAVPLASPHTRTQRFLLSAGPPQVIKGWDEGVAKMSLGEKSLLTCSPDYGEWPL